eukprot:768800-Hanusia_phi.AAC.11
MLSSLSQRSHSFHSETRSGYHLSSSSKQPHQDSNSTIARLPCSLPPPSPGAFGEDVGGRVLVQDEVSHRQPDPLARGGRVHAKVALLARVSPRRSHGLPDGVEDGDGEVERGLADALGRVDGPPVGAVLEEFHAQVDRDVVSRRDLVRRGPPREQLSVVHPHELLQREEPQPLHERALHLPHVHRRVQRVPDVVQDVSAEGGEVSGQHVDLNLRARDPVGEVVEGPALARLEVVADVRRLVEAMRRQVHPVQPRRHGNLRERRSWFRMPEPLEPGGDLLARVLHGEAVEICPDGGGGRVSVSALVGGRLGDEDLVKCNSELRGRDLTHLGVQPLPHLCPSMRDQDGPVGVDVDERRSLQAEVRRRQAGEEGEAEVPTRCDGILYGRTRTMRAGGGGDERMRGGE